MGLQPVGLVALKNTSEPQALAVGCLGWNVSRKAHG